MNSASQSAFPPGMKAPYVTREETRKILHGCWKHRKLETDSIASATIYKIVKRQFPEEFVSARMQKQAGTDSQMGIILRNLVNAITEHLKIRQNLQTCINYYKGVRKAEVFKNIGKVLFGIGVVGTLIGVAGSTIGDLAMRDVLEPILGGILISGFGVKFWVSANSGIKGLLDRARAELVKIMDVKDVALAKLGQIMKEQDAIDI